MPSTVPELLAIIRPLLNDAVPEYLFSDDELVRWLSDAQREIVRNKPEANPITAVHVVDATRPYQELSLDDAAALIRVEANGHGDGAVPMIVEPEAWTIGTESSSASATRTLSYTAGLNPDYGHHFGERSATVIVFHYASSAGTTPTVVSLTYGGQAVPYELISIVGDDTRTHITGIGVLMWNDGGVDMSPTDNTITLTMSAANGYRSRIQARTWNNVASYSTPQALSAASAALVFSGHDHVPGGSVAIFCAKDNSNTNNHVPPAPWTEVDDLDARSIFEVYSHDTWSRFTTLADATPYGMSVGSSPAFSTLNLGVFVMLSGEALPGPNVWGTVVRRVDRHALDSMDSAWGFRDPPAVTPAADTYYKEWSLVPDNERAFYLYPAPDPTADNDVLVTYAGIPPEIASPVSTLTLSEVYDFDIINYVLYRAASDQAQSYSKQGADTALQRFTANLTLDRAEVKRLGGTNHRATENTR